MDGTEWFVGARVVRNHGSWTPDWVFGNVMKVLKTRVHVLMDGDSETTAYTLGGVKVGDAGWTRGHTIRLTTPEEEQSLKTEQAADLLFRRSVNRLKDTVWSHQSPEKLAAIIEILDRIEEPV